MMAPAPYDVVKRSLDVVASAALLVVASPVVAIASVGVAATLGRPVLFRQRRPGRDGVPFTLLKLRTMRAPDAVRIDDAARLTRLGRLLRSTSVDELPSLWNVLRGDMSIVGPRPLLVEYLPRYDAHQARRHEIRPGITGLAQVSGRNAIGWPERLDLDVRYVDERSLALDARILLETVRTVVSRRDVSAPGHATQPPFEGGRTA